VSRWRVTAFVLPVIAFLLWLCVKRAWPDFYTAQIQEDSFIEYAQAALYLVAAALAVRVARRAARSGLAIPAVLYALLAAAFLFTAIEEVSWGQRIWGSGVSI
jgi:hypothetical protein